MCGKTTQVEVPWARAGAGFTQTLEAFVVALCTQMPVHAVARLLGVSDDRVWRVLDFHVEAARACEDYSEVRRISADERSAHKGHRYLTMFCDLDARRLLFAAQAKDGATFKAFADDLAAHGGDIETITDVSLDLGRPIRPAPVTTARTRRSASIRSTWWPWPMMRSIRCAAPRSSTRLI